MFLLRRIKLFFIYHKLRKLGDLELLKLHSKKGSIGTMREIWRRQRISEVKGEVLK